MFSSFKLNAICSRIMKNKNMLLFSLLTIIIVILFLYYIRNYINSVKEYNVEGMTSSSENMQQAEIIFFFADWCPHCTKAKPIVADIKSKYNGLTINNKNIIFKDVDCSVETQDTKREIEKYDVESFPTILIQIGDKVTKFDDTVENSKLSEFIENTLA